MWDKIQMGLFLVFLLFCAFTSGRYFQDNYLLTHNDSVTVHALMDKNCIKL